MAVAAAAAASSGGGGGFFPAQSACLSACLPHLGVGGLAILEAKPMSDHHQSAFGGVVENAELPGMAVVGLAPFHDPAKASHHQLPRLVSASLACLCIARQEPCLLPWACANGVPFILRCFRELLLVN